MTPTYAAMLGVDGWGVLSTVVDGHAGGGGHCRKAACHNVYVRNMNMAINAYVNVG